MGLLYTSTLCKQIIYIYIYIYIMSVFDHLYTDPVLYSLNSVMAQRCIDSPLYWVTSTWSLVYWFTSVLAHLCTGSLLHWYTSLLAHLCTGSTPYWLIPDWLTSLLAQINWLTSVLADLCNVWPRYWINSVLAHLCTGSLLFWLTSCTGWLLKWLIPLLAHHSTSPRCVKSRILPLTALMKHSK
jgi:hypothetical protein